MFIGVAGTLRDDLPPSVDVDVMQDGDKATPLSVASSAESVGELGLR